MKTKIKLSITALILLVCSSAFSQGTAFTYQGRLNDTASPANGNYDLRFALYDSPSAGTQQGNLYTNPATAISNGLFTVTLDFGNQFPGAPRWLEIAVRTNGASNFTIMAPRQQLTPTPYAVTAENVSGTLTSANLPASPTISGTVTAGGFSGDGSQLTGVNAATLNGLASTHFWQVGGNSGANPTNGAFLGTTDNLPLELKVGGSRALRLEYVYNPTYGNVDPNVIGGYSGNFASNNCAGATIIGGGDFGVPNIVGALYATVLGGEENTASGTASLASGEGSTASGFEAIAMGNINTSEGNMSVAMGAQTTALGDESMALGYKSYAGGESSFALGNYADAGHNGSFVWADDSKYQTYFADTEPNQFLIRAAGGVGIGTTLPPPGGLEVASGGLAVTGASSPNYPGATGVFIENESGYGVVYAFNYSLNAAMPLCLNTPGGNVGIGTTTPAYTLQVAGSCAATTFVTTSDRNAKENFQPVNAAEILDQVASLPLSRWNFKEDKSQRHLGPMAQDFYTAFNVGADDKHIATVDEDGVALAAIQGLNQKLEAGTHDSEARITKLEAENAELKHRLEALERAFREQKEKE